MTQPIPSMSGHTAVPVDCLICRMWDQMPYAKRHTTPMSAQEGEGCLIVGFWLRARHPADQAVRYCQRHAATMMMLDDRQAAQDKAKANAIALAASPEAQRAAILRGRVNDLAAKTIAPVLAPPLVSPPVLPVIFPAVSPGAREALAGVQPGEVVTTDGTLTPFAAAFPLGGGAGPAPTQSVPTCTCSLPVAGTTYCDHCRHQPGCPVHVFACPKSAYFGVPLKAEAGNPGMAPGTIVAIVESGMSLAAEVIASTPLPAQLDFPPSAESLAGQAGSILQDGLPEKKEEVKVEPTKFPCPLCSKPTFSGDIHVCS